MVLPAKQLRDFSTDRMKAMELPGRMFGVGVGVSEAGDALGATDRGEGLQYIVSCQSGFV